ncbi:MAG TPA: hypothetical protein PK511_07285 [Chitinophagales bacterium]|nr:hypothetical protein [Chitinophagales bacterium]
MQRLLPICILLSSSLNLQAQSLVTALIQHGNDSQQTTSIVADPDNYMVAAVNFWDDLDADPGVPVVNFNTAGTMDVAIIKLDPAGNYVWGKQLAGAGWNASSDIACDALGNIFIFGYYNGTMDMDPGPGTSNITSAGGDDIFVGKYDTNGNLLWAYSIGGTGTEQNYGFDVGPDNNTVLYGYFQNTVDFNPGGGTFNLTAAVGGSNFILKLNNNGTFNYAVSMGSAYGNELKIDAANNIYCTGLFWSTVDFDPGVATYNLTAAGFTNDSYIQKLSPTGGFLWAGKFSSSLADQGTCIAIDNINNTVSVGGFFEGTIDADPGIGTANIASGGYVDAYVINLNASTGNYNWGKSFSGLGWQALHSMDVSSTGSVIVAGSFDQTADFNPGAGTFNMTSAGSTDIFKVALNSDGSFSSAEQIGSNGQDQPICLAIDQEGAVLLTGFFENIVDFDPGANVFNLNAAFTGWDGFIAKYCTVYTINNYVNICSGDSYFAAGANQTTSGDYYDYYTPVEGCDSIVITHLTVNNPTVNLGPDANICAGTTFTLDAENTGADYLWNTGATTQTINITATGTYSVTVTDDAGCIAADAITVTVQAAPVLELGPTIHSCADEFVLLDAGNAGADYLWNTGATTQTISVNTSGNYSVTVTNDFGCTTSDLVHVTVHALPVVDLLADEGICEGETLLLDAGNPGSTFAWNTGATTQTITVSDADTYSVIVTNAWGCDASDAITITINPTPVIDLGADISLCDGESIILDATADDATYLWNTGATTSTITVTETGDYNVEVSNIFGCSAVDNIHVEVHPLPIVDLGEDAAFCEDEFMVLDAENPGSTYLWNTGETTSTIIVTDDGTYSVDVISAFGCVSSDTISITIHPLPVADLGADVTSCSNVPVLLDATTPFCLYAWSTGETTPNIVVDESGEYWVTITNSFGCQITDSITVSMLALPEVDLELEPTICVQDPAFTLSGGTPSGGTYFGDGIIDGIFNPAAAGTGTHNIYYTYTDANGCSDTAMVSVTVNICNGIADNNATAISVFPNPAMNDITINLPSNLTSAEYVFMQADGRAALSGTAQSNLQVIDISTLAAGYYTLIIADEGNIISAPVFVTK